MHPLKKHLSRILFAAILLLSFSIHAEQAWGTDDDLNPDFLAFQGPQGAWDWKNIKEQNCFFFPLGLKNGWIINRPYLTLEQCKVMTRRSVVWHFFHQQGFNGEQGIREPDLSFPEYVTFVEKGIMVFVPRGSNFGQALHCRIWLRRDVDGMLIRFPAKMVNIKNHLDEATEQELEPVLEYFVHIKCPAP